MKIEVIYFDGCPFYPLAAELLRKMLEQEGVIAPVDLVPVSSHEEAVGCQFLGSPTIRIDGEDVEVAARAREDFGMKCRLYSVSGRLVGVPDADTLRAAIRAAKRKELDRFWAETTC